MDDSVEVHTEGSSSPGDPSPPPPPLSGLLCWHGTGTGNRQPATIMVGADAWETGAISQEQTYETLR
jgi:hypothetical protein